MAVADALEFDESRGARPGSCDGCARSGRRIRLPATSAIPRSGPRRARGAPPRIFPRPAGNARPPPGSAAGCRAGARTGGCVAGGSASAGAWVSRPAMKVRARSSAAARRFGAHRLHQVIDGGGLESRQRVLVVGGAEHHGRARVEGGQVAGGLQSVDARAWRCPAGPCRGGFCAGLQRVQAVVGLGDDLHAGDARPAARAGARGPGVRRRQ